MVWRPPRGPSMGGSASPPHPLAPWVRMPGLPIRSLPHLVLAVELLVGNVGWEVRVQEGTEGQPVIPAAAEVCNVDVLQEEKGNT